MTLPIRALAAVAAAAIAAGGFGAGKLTTSSSSASAGCTPIGFQNGITAASARMKRLDPGGFNATGTGAWDKYFRSVKRLVDDHDAACAGTPPTTTTAPPTTTTAPGPLPSPQTYNRGSNGQDARYCVNGGAGGTDAAGYRYDSGGRELDGRRTGNKIDVLKPSDEMDGREPCDPYTKDGRSFPPWPPESYQR